VEREGGEGGKAKCNVVIEQCYIVILPTCKTVYSIISGLGLGTTDHTICFPCLAGVTTDLMI
jgi:hypothetical protein